MSKRWENKTVVVGITGGIAAYKSLDLISHLRKQGAKIIPVFSPSASEFVTELSVASMAGHPVFGGSVLNEKSGKMHHIELARQADLVVIAPTTANTIAKLANGFADDPLTTLMLAYDGPVVIAPAMNTVMWSKRVTRKNINALVDHGYLIAQPESGLLACGEEGFGRLASLEKIEAVMRRAITEQDYTDVKVILTAGPTREAIDPVRYISNHSSGKMGWSLARAAWERGAKVTLVHGPVNMPVPFGVKSVSVNSAEEMHEAFFHQVKVHGCNLAIMSAAVADFKPANDVDDKIKKEYDENGNAIAPTIQLTANPDILADFSKGRDYNVTTKVVGFAAETSKVLERAREKFKRKGCEFLVVNDVSKPESGFGSDTNRVTLLKSDGNEETFDIMSKEKLAHKLLDQFNV